MRNVFNLPLYPPPPSTPPPPPHHKKRRETPSSLLWTKREISLRREGCDYAFRKEQKSLEKKGGELGGGDNKSLTLLKFLHPGAGCAETCSCWLWVRLSSLRACVKTNLPGVSSSQMEERIIWLSIVGVNERGLAANSQRFSFFFLKQKKITKNGIWVTFSSGECLIGHFSG